MLHVCFNTVHVKQVLPKTVFQPSLRKFLLKAKAINRVLTPCHLLDNLLTTKKCAQELELCISTVRLLRVFSSLNEALGCMQTNFSNLFDSQLFPIYYGRRFAEMIHMLRINLVTSKQ